MQWLRIKIRVDNVQPVGWWLACNAEKLERCWFRLPLSKGGLEHGTTWLLGEPPKHSAVEQKHWEGEGMLLWLKLRNVLMELYICLARVQSVAHAQYQCGYLCLCAAHGMGSQTVSKCQKWHLCYWEAVKSGRILPQVTLQWVHPANYCTKGRTPGAPINSNTSPCLF